METSNLLMSCKPEDVFKTYSMLSSSEENRSKIVEDLLTGNPLDINIDLENRYDNYNAKIFEVYLKSLGLKIVE